MLEHATIDVQLSQCQPTHRHLVVVGRQGFLFEKVFGLTCRLVRIVCKHSLIKILLQCQGGLVAQHDVKEFQSLDMSAQNDQAEGQRGRKQKSHWSPKPCPEGGRHNDCNGG